MEKMKVIYLLFWLFVSAKAVDDKCFLQPYAGQVQAGTEKLNNAIESYSYSAETNECYAFNYSGSGGNDNRFKTLRECENECKEKNPCLQKPFSGNGEEGLSCFMWNDAWSYVAGKNECVYYEFSCGGNENVFQTLEDCNSKCKRDVKVLLRQRKR